MNQPSQELIKDKEGTIRFKPNWIVKFLASKRLNELAEMDFPQEDWEQLFQLIGYSVEGFYELSYVSDKTREEVKTNVRCFENGLLMDKMGELNRRERELMLKLEDFERLGF
jgi:hypothetical protein